MITKAQYLDVKSKLSFSKPTWITLALLASDTALFFFCFWLLSRGTFITYLASQILFAVFFFHCFAILHDAGHGNVSSKKWVNTVVGHIAGVFSFLPFFSWKYLHNEHHIWSGNIDKDPALEEIKPFMNKHDVPKHVRFLWHTCIPLVALQQHFVFWTYPIKMWRNGSLSKKQALECIFSTAFWLGSYVVLFTYFPTWFNFSNFWLAIVFYLVLTEVINLPHHLIMPAFRDGVLKKLHPWEQTMVTRTCDYRYFVSELLCYNFNLHSEHHFFPSMPWYRLKQVRKLIKPLLGKDYHETIGMRWHFENRPKDAREVLLLPELTAEMVHGDAKTVKKLQVAS